MARTLGDVAVALIGSDVISQVTTISVDDNREEIPANTINSSQATSESGQRTITVDLTMQREAGDTAQDAIRAGYAANTTVALKIRPEGTGSGLPEWTMTAKVASVSHQGIEFNAVEIDVVRFINPAADYAEGVQP